MYITVQYKEQGKTIFPSKMWDFPLYAMNMVYLQILLLFYILKDFILFHCLFYTSVDKWKYFGTIQYDIGV